MFTATLDLWLVGSGVPTQVGEIDGEVSPLQDGAALESETLVPEQVVTPGEQTVVAYRLTAVGSEPVDEVITLRASWGEESREIVSREVSVDPGKSEVFVAEVPAPDTEGEATLALERASGDNVLESTLTVRNRNIITQIRGYDAETNELIIVAANPGGEAESHSFVVDRQFGDTTERLFETTTDIDPGVTTFRAEIGSDSDLSSGEVRLDIVGGLTETTDHQVKEEYLRVLGTEFVPESLDGLVDESVTESGNSAGENGQTNDGSQDNSDDSGLISLSSLIIIAPLSLLGFIIGAGVVLKLRS